MHRTRDAVTREAWASLVVLVLIPIGCGRDPAPPDAGARADARRSDAAADAGDSTPDAGASDGTVEDPLDGGGAPGATTTPDWTEFSPSADTRTIYVSSSRGDDGNDGLSEATPKASIDAGIALLRDGHPDWLLLRRGDTFDGGFSLPDISGRSASEPMLLSSYGPETAPRPVIDSGSSAGLYVCCHGRNSFIAVVGLHFTTSDRDGSGANNGVRWTSSGESILFEDLLVEGYDTNIIVVGSGDGITDFRLRYSVVVDAYEIAPDHSQGLFAARDIDGFVVEGCVFDNNGWNADVPGAEKTVFNHNFYIKSEITGVVLRDNIIANASATGAQARGGGLVERNVFVRNPLALNWGMVTGGAEPLPGGVTGAIRDNVVLDGNDIGDSPRGVGFNIANVASGTVENNVIAHVASSESGTGIGLTGDIRDEPDDGLHDLTVTGNLVYDWRNPLGIRRGVNSVDFTGVTVRDNSFQVLVPYSNGHGRVLSQWNADEPITSAFSFGGNTYYTPQTTEDWFRLGDTQYGPSAWPGVSGESDGTYLSAPRAYSDPERSLGSYRDAVEGIGGSTVADFLAEARRQRKGYWRADYAAVAVIDYIREGFDLEPLE